MQRQKFLLFRVHRFGDAHAYEELYELYLVRIRRYIYFKVPRSEDADELTSEVFLRGWEYMTSSRVDHAAALYYRIARNVIADFYRKRKVTEPIEVALHMSSEGHAIPEQIAKSEEQRILLDTLKKLREEYRDVLIMKYLDEMSTKEISAALEKTPNHIRVLLHRAKRALRTLSEKQHSNK